MWCGGGGGKRDTKMKHIQEQNDKRPCSEKPSYDRACKRQCGINHKAETPTLCNAYAVTRNMKKQKVQDSKSAKSGIY